MDVCVKQLDTKSVIVQLTIHSGANVEKADEKGIAHFLEHVVFEKTRDFGR